MSRGAPPGVVNDESPLDGASLDIGARAGWVLRMARLSASGGAPSLESLASALDTSVARLHRVETGQVHDGQIVDGYERALGRPEGALRAPIDVLRRTFPAGPRDRGRGTVATTVREMSTLTDQVGRPGATGGRWLRWARSLSQAGAIGMPEALATELVGMLVGELQRAVGTGYPSRYEALALLRCGPYGDVVLDVARHELADPHVQVLFDLMSAVGEAVTPRAVAWCLDLLDDHRDPVVVAGALALENMGQISPDPGFWAGVVEPMITRFNDAEVGSAAWLWLSHLLRLVPASVHAGRALRPRQALAPVAGVADWSRTQVNSHWVDCQRRAADITDEVGVADQPMLARLLFDITISPYESRAVTSYMLIGALPAVVGPVAAQLAELADGHDDPVVRRQVGRRLPGTLHGVLPDRARAWLVGPDDEARVGALKLAGAAGVPADEGILAAALATGTDARRAALYCAGMTGHPALPALRTHPEAEVAGGARWWLAKGPRVVDPPLHDPFQFDASPK